VQEIEAFQATAKTLVRQNHSCLLFHTNDVRNKDKTKAIALVDRTGLESVASGTARQHPRSNEAREVNSF
jgi:hypothetical protein